MLCYVMLCYVTISSLRHFVTSGLPRGGVDNVSPLLSLYLSGMENANCLHLFRANWLEQGRLTDCAASDKDDHGGWVGLGCGPS